MVEWASGNEGALMRRAANISEAFSDLRSSANSVEAIKKLIAENERDLALGIAPHRRADIERKLVKWRDKLADLARVQVTDRPGHAKPGESAQRAMQTETDLEAKIARQRAARLSATVERGG